MKLRVIYPPRGPALEYAPLAVSLYHGPCPVGCKFCFVPDFLGLTRDPAKLAAWRASPFEPRTRILEKLQRDCQDLQAAGDDREILLSFMHDIPDDPAIHMEAFQILAHYGRRISVLTKRPTRLRGALGFFRAQHWRLAVTLCWTDDQHRRFWEPGADTVEDRLDMLAQARQAGVRTWVSMEPVIIPAEALECIKALWLHADEIRVGKLNGRDVETKRIERETDWGRFLQDVEALWSEQERIGTTGVGPKLVIKRALEQHRRAK